MGQLALRRINVFFYGLFMDAKLLREKGINPVNGRLAAVENFELRIAQRATLVPSDGHVVYGFLFSLTHGEIDRLYAEPSVKAYRPEAMFARVEDGTTIPCLCFNLPDVNLEEKRNEEYADKLRALATRLGLPASYREVI